MIDLALRPSWQRLAVLLAIALALQTTLFNDAAFRGVVPSATLILIVWYALSAGQGYGALFGAIAGACEDALSYGTGGAWAISGAVTGFLLGTARGAFFTDSITPAAVAVFLATLARSAVFWIVMAVEGYPNGLRVAHAHAALLQGVLNVALYLVVMIVSRRWDPWPRR